MCDPSPKNGSWIWACPCLEYLIAPKGLITGGWFITPMWILYCNPKTSSSFSQIIIIPVIIWEWAKTHCYHHIWGNKHPLTSYFKVPRLHSVPKFWLTDISHHMVCYNAPMFFPKRKVCTLETELDKPTPGGFLQHMCTLVVKHGDFGKISFNVFFHRKFIWQNILYHVWPSEVVRSIYIYRYIYIYIYIYICIYRQRDVWDDKSHGS